MIDPYTGKKIVSPLDLFVDIPISAFGKITESQLTIPGNFIINSSNTETWKQALTEINDLLTRFGIRV